MIYNIFTFLLHLTYELKYRTNLYIKYLKDCSSIFIFYIKNKSDLVVFVQQRSAPSVIQLNKPDHVIEVVHLIESYSSEDIVLAIHYYFV